MFGRRETAVMSVVNAIDNFRREIIYHFNWLFSSDLRKQMAENKKFENYHKGQRCFIIGNGPSLKHHDLSKLTHECVFTVNYMMKSEHFATLNPNYHLFFDPVVFELDPTNEDDKIKIELISKTHNTNPDLTYVIPYRMRNNFMNLFPKHRFIFVYNRKTYTSKLKNPFSLNRITPGFQNIILHAISTAIYMGFKEIYLLGVDMTGFLEHFEYNKINDQWGHSYKKTKLEQSNIKKYLQSQNFDNEFYLKAYGKTLEQFKRMKKHAASRKVNIFNASEHGALDVIERVNYEKLFPYESI